MEDIILRYGKRGMDILRTQLGMHYLTDAADLLLRCPKGNVLCTTGFFVQTAAETDGPPGIYAVACALRELGYTPVIVSDVWCTGLFEPYGFETVYYPLDADESYARSLLDRYSPVLLLSLERCGRNASGSYANMRGIDIRRFTAPIDDLFLLAQGSIPTIGIGDGGNEIGMGTLRSAIEEQLHIHPCIVPADALIVATVSNWGGYGLCAALEQRTGKPVTPDADDILAFLSFIVEKGCVDGISGRNVTLSDGFDTTTIREILTDLRQAVRQ